MDKKNEEATSATATNPLYQGTARLGSEGDAAEASINGADDDMKTMGDGEEALPEESA